MQKLEHSDPESLIATSSTLTCEKTPLLNWGTADSHRNLPARSGKASLVFSKEDMMSMFRLGTAHGMQSERNNQDEAAKTEPGVCSKLLKSFVLGSQTAAVNTAVSIAGILATGFLSTQIGPVFDEKRPLAPARHLLSSVFGLQTAT